jgi:hypothetical protein
MPGLRGNITMREHEVETSAPGRINLESVAQAVLVTLGIASATLLAHSAFGMRFNEDFLLLLKVVENTVGTILFPIELLVVTPLMGWLQEQGMALNLYPHWRYAFVLLWLYFGSELRAVAPLSLITAGDSVGVSIATLCRWAWAAATALTGGILAGTVPISDPAVFWWPVMSYFLSMGGDSAILAFFWEKQVRTLAPSAMLVATLAALALGWIVPIALSGQPSLFWWAVAAYFAYVALIHLLTTDQDGSAWAYPIMLLAIAALAATLAYGLIPEPYWLKFNSSPSPGLSNLAAWIAVVASLNILCGMLFAEESADGYLNSLISDNRIYIALGVLTVLGGSATIVYIAQLMA